MPSPGRTGLVLSLSHTTPAMLSTAMLRSILAAICGYRRHAVNETKLPLYLKYTPAGTSVQNMAHWVRGPGVGLTLGLGNSLWGAALPTVVLQVALPDSFPSTAAHHCLLRLPRSQAQSVRGGSTPGRPAFTAFDYGTNCGLRPMCNQKKYGSNDPPEYQLASISPRAKLALFTGGPIGPFACMSVVEEVCCMHGSEISCQSTLLLRIRVACIEPPFMGCFATHQQVARIAWQTPLILSSC